jgi:hypothetical protein
MESSPPIYKNIHRVSIAKSVGLINASAGFMAESPQCLLLLPVNF